MDRTGSGQAARRVLEARVATSFLSRLPVYPSGHDDIALGRTVWAFPVAGVVIAFVPVLILLGSAASGLPPVVTAILAVGSLIVTTGALHEDGLADCVDGFFGAAEPSRKRAIMRDSSVGTYGVLALVLAVALRIALLAALVAQDPSIAVAGVIGAAAASRGAMGMVWAALPAAPSLAQNGAKGESLSSALQEPSATIGRWCAAVACGLLVTVLPWFGFGPVLAAGAAGALAALGMARLAKRHVGGHTGDVLGATQQCAEMGFLLGLVATI